MRYKGKIKELNHIVVSDPSYNQKVKCRYEYDNINGKDWLFDLNINIRDVYYNNEFIGKTINYLISLRKNKDNIDFDETGKINKLQNISVREFDIGCDTACVAFGINEKADEIIDSKDEWQPSCALKTGGDGMVATVIQGKDKRDLVYIQLKGDFDYDLISEEELLNYIVNQFEISNLEKESIKEEFNL